MKTYDTHYFLSTVFRLRRLKRSCLNLTWFLKEDWAFPSIPSSLTLTESQLLRLTWSTAGIVNNNLSASPVVFPFFWKYHQTNVTTRLLQNSFFDWANFDVANCRTLYSRVWWATDDEQMPTETHTADIFHVKSQCISWSMNTGAVESNGEARLFNGATSWDSGLTLWAAEDAERHLSGLNFLQPYYCCVSGFQFRARRWDDLMCSLAVTFTLNQLASRAAP